MVFDISGGFDGHGFRAHIIYWSVGLVPKVDKRLASSVVRPFETIFVLTNQGPIEDERETGVS